MEEDVQHINENNQLLRYDNQIFTVITEENYEDVIHTFCEELYMADSGVQDAKIARNFVQELEKLLKKFPRPFTIIQEAYHIDRSFRDTYYTYFSNQHFDIKRHSRRISFVKQIITEKEFFSSDIDTRESISNNFMGTCVINPLSSGVIGRTLIDPHFLLPKCDRPAFVRLSKFKIHVYGKKFL